MKTQNILIAEGTVRLEGILVIPPKCHGLVLFAHGSGSSRLSPRNQYVARVLQDAGIGTLLFDLLTETEDTAYERRFDIDLLTKRLLLATHWLLNDAKYKKIPLGYFGASTGAAAALDAAAEMKERIAAVVSRGGRPDMAKRLTEVSAATLLIVGEQDMDVLELNRQAYAFLRCQKRLEIVPKATHLFEEPGALEAVAGLAKEWFWRYIK